MNRYWLLKFTPSWSSFAMNMALATLFLTLVLAKRSLMFVNTVARRWTLGWPMYLRTHQELGGVVLFTPRSSTCYLFFNICRVSIRILDFCHENSFHHAMADTEAKCIKFGDASLFQEAIQTAGNTQHTFGSIQAKIHGRMCFSLQWCADTFQVMWYFVPTTPFHAFGDRVLRWLQNVCRCDLENLTLAVDVRVLALIIRARLNCFPIKAMTRPVVCDDRVIHSPPSLLGETG